VSIKHLNGSGLYTGGKNTKVWDQVTVQNDFQSIATVVVPSGGQSSVTFSNIPSTFTHLQVRVSGRGTTTFSGGLSLYVSPIGPTSSATKRHWLDGNGSSSGSSYDSGSGLVAVIADGGALSNVYSAVILDILDWSNTSKNITFRAIGGYDSNGGTGHSVLASGLVVLSGGTTTGFTFQTDGNWVQYSQISLYGIKAAS
jgi:hypothetical protein